MEGLLEVFKGILFILIVAMYAWFYDSENDALNNSQKNPDVDQSKNSNQEKL